MWCGQLVLQKQVDVYLTMLSILSSSLPLFCLQDVLVPVFENGELLRDYTLEEIRQRAELSADDIDVLKFLKEDKS